MQQVIRGALREVDKSRVYVDTRGIQSALPPELRIDIERFLEIARLPVRLRTVIAKISPSGDLVLAPTARFGDLGEKLFELVFADITTRFIFSNEHGLDSFLSVQVRHGTLGGELRAPFEGAHLVTRQEAGSD